MVEPKRMPTLAWSLCGEPTPNDSSATSRETVKPMPATMASPAMSIHW